MQGDATLLHIKQSTLVELSGTGAVVAAHIIVVNLQLRLGKHTRFAGGAKVAVGLFRNRMMCSREHLHQTSIGAYGLIVQYIFKELVARGVRHYVLYQRMVIDMLLFISDDQSIERQFGTFAAQINLCGIAVIVCCQTDILHKHLTIGFLADMKVVSSGDVSSVYI